MHLRNVLRKLNSFLKTINSIITILFYTARILLSLIILKLKITLLRVRVRFWLFRNKRKFAGILKSSGFPQDLTEKLVETYVNSTISFIEQSLRHKKLFLRI